MKTALKIVLAPLCIVSFAVMAAAQNWFPGSVDEAVAKAKAENKLVIIDFYSGG